MSVSHPPEPWNVVRYANAVYTSPGNVTVDHAGDGTALYDVEEITARRIVACVNALAGVPTEEIEQVVELGKIRLKTAIELGIIHNADTLASSDTEVQDKRELDARELRKETE